MKFEEPKEAIRTFIHEHAFCMEECAFSSGLESYFFQIEPVKLYQLGLATYSRVDCELLFLYTPRVWREFSIDDWILILCGIARNQNTVWALDHGGYFDVRFLISMLRLNAFRLVKIAMEPGINQQRIFEYGINNAGLIMTDRNDNYDDEEPPGPFTAIFEESRAMSRLAVLSSNPTLDIEGWSVYDLVQDLQRIRQILK